MDIDKLKSACGAYYGETQKKENGQGGFLYRTIPQSPSGMMKGLMPLGYFNTELEAVQALYNFLINNDLINANS